MSTEKHYEMLWDCQFCGTEKLLGKTHRFCPNCGSPQNPDARYFPPDEEKVAVEDHEYVGRDVHCPACDSLNSATAVHCGTCGAPLEGGRQAGRIADGSWMGNEDAASFAQSRDVGRESRQRDLEKSGGTESESSGNTGRFIAIGLFVAVLLIGGLIYLFSQTEEQTVVVSGHTWERTIGVEAFSQTEDEDWQEDVPAAAYNVQCRQRQRRTEQVPDGEECRTVRRDNGDGTFTERQECEQLFREEPVLDDWCTYNIDMWTSIDPIVTSGTSLDAVPEWGETSFRCSGPRIGCQREADRSESYTVLFDADGETYRCTFPQDEWVSFSIGSRFAMEVRQFAGGAVCSSLEPR